MPVPPELNWDMWLGQAPLVDYTEKRCHYEFRWWYEYSGGKMTDWGAHHVDIATWAIGADNTGPISVEGTAKHPNIPNGYNTATEFLVTCKYADGAELVIRHDTENGITFEGDKGTFFVSRGALDRPAGRRTEGQSAARRRHREALRRQADQPHGQLLRVRQDRASSRSPTSSRITAR